MIDTPEKQTTAPETETQRTARTVWWIVGAVCTGLVLLVAVTATGTWLWWNASPEKSETRSETYTQATTGVDVTVEVGRIELNAGADSLVVGSEIRWRGEEPEPIESWTGDTFTAVGECDDRFVLFWGGDDCEVNYTLALPGGVAVEAESSLGDIAMDGLDGGIDVETSVGDIEGESLRATETRAEVGVGSIRLTYAEVRGDIYLTTGTGDVEIVLPDDGTTYDVVFETGVGTEHIDIATDPSNSADYVIHVNTGVGDLTVRHAD